MLLKPYTFVITSHNSLGTKPFLCENKMVEIKTIPRIEIKGFTYKSNVAKEVQLIFKPLHIVQSAFMLSKYTIKEDLIQPNSFVYNVISGISNLIIYMVILYAILRNCIGIDMEHVNHVIFYTTLQCIPILCVGGITNFTTNVFYRHTNVLLAIKIKNFYEFLKINKRSLKIFAIVNWVSAMSVVFFQLIWIIYFYFAFSAFAQISQLIWNMIYIIFDINILFATRVLKFITMALRLWVKKATESMLKFESRTYWNKMHKLFEEILEGFELLRITFQPLVSDVLKGKLTLIAVYVYALVD